MSIKFWYHPESDSFFTTTGETVDPLAIEVPEQEWIDKQIERALNDKIAPDGCDAILVEAMKTLSFGKPVLTGKIYLREGIPDGTECTTTPIQEDLGGNRFRTKNTTYLVKWAKQPTDQLKSGNSQDASGVL